MKGKFGWGLRSALARKEVEQTLTVVADITLNKEEVKDVGEGITNEGIADLKRSYQEAGVKTARKMARMEDWLRAEIAKAREPIAIPECPICLEELRPPLRIVQCLKGHKICEPCSEKEEVKGCPDGCRAGLMGRDHGMEAFVRQLLGEQE